MSEFGSEISSDKNERKHVDGEMKTHYVRETVSPYTEKDQAGIERKIYSYQGSLFSFKGKEELPIYHTLQETQTTLLGDKPVWSAPSDVAVYQDEIQKDVSGKPKHFLVDRTLAGCVDLALHLGADDSVLQTIHNELYEKKYSDDALHLLDELIAMKYAGNLQTGSNGDLDSEAIVVLSWLGDPQAIEIVSEAKKKFAQKVHNNHAHHDIQLPEKQAESLDLHELCVVHSTNYSPENHGSAVFVQSAFDATNKKIPRSSIHTALNHKVHEHAMGSWADAGVVIIAPFDKMIESNGVPSRLNTVDTYWNLNPGQRLTFPDATVVVPNDGVMDSLYTWDGNVVSWKSGDVGVRDLVQLYNAKKSEKEKYDFAYYFDSMFLNEIGSNTSDENWIVDDAVKRITQHFYGKDFISYGDTTNIFSAIAQQASGDEPRDFKEIIHSMFEESGIELSCISGLGDQSKLIDELTNSLASCMRRGLLSKINEHVVNEVITTRGYQVQSGGDWAWGDSMDVTMKTRALAQQLGCEIGAHSSTAEYRLTKDMLTAVSTAMHSEDNQFDWTQIHTDSYDWDPMLDPQTRRVLYEFGWSNCRRRDERTQDGINDNAAPFV